MARFLAGAAACFLLLTGAFLLWQGQAQEVPLLPDAPRAAPGSPSMVVAGAIPQAPEASPQSREQRRFSRTDKDKDGRIAKEELLAARRKAYAKLDVDRSGTVSFDEWAVKTLDKFGGADKARSGWLADAGRICEHRPAAAQAEALRLLA